MSNEIMTEEILQFGNDSRLFGILTLPSLPQQHAKKLPVFVFLSSGFTHRVGPLRIYVRLARVLAQMGFSSFRVDLTGRGDSAGRPELRNEESLMADYKEIVKILDGRLGPSQLVLGGLCSGADNALILAQADQRVIGLLLMDPTCYPDDGFRVRQFFRKLAHPERYMKPARYVLWLQRRMQRLARREPSEIDDDPYTYTPLAFGNLPTREQLRAAFAAVCERKGRALSVFTSMAEELGRYNQVGQLGRQLGLPGYAQYCTEKFFSNAGHTFDLELHRRRLLNEVKAWAAAYL